MASVTFVVGNLPVGAIWCKSCEKNTHLYLVKLYAKLDGML